MMPIITDHAHGHIRTILQYIRTMHMDTYVPCTWTHTYHAHGHVRIMHMDTYVPCTWTHTYHAHGHIRTMHMDTYVPCTWTHTYHAHGHVRTMHMDTYVLYCICTYAVCQPAYSDNVYKPMSGNGYAHACSAQMHACKLNMHTHMIGPTSTVGKNSTFSVHTKTTKSVNMHDGIHKSLFMSYPRSLEGMTRISSISCEWSRFENISTRPVTSLQVVKETSVITCYINDMQRTKDPGEQTLEHTLCNVLQVDSISPVHTHQISYSTMTSGHM